MLGGIGFPELVLIFGIILLLFGAKKLPELARSIGKGINEFKGGLKDTESSNSKQSKKTIKKEKT